MEIVLIAQVCMYNEVLKGNLDRCLDNLRRYCDHIVIYDDASTDNSVEVALKYTPHIIRGEVNNQMQELAHKQMILEKSLELGATHLFWLDCDEVLERDGTMGGLRELCDNWPDGLDAYSFRELNLWRSQTYVRTDSLFSVARFVRLWKVVPGISFTVRGGVHLRLYPKTIENVQEAPFGVIHYGFWDYKKMLVKIGAHLFDWKELQTCSLTNWILGETGCSCYRLPDKSFPPGCLPPDIWDQPQPRLTSDLLPDPPDELLPPLMDKRAVAEWGRLHHASYHGTYKKTHTRNSNIWEAKTIDCLNRISLLRFDPKGKIIFDVGCGGGWFMLDCLINGAKEVIGFEIDSKLIKRATRSFQKLGVQSSLYSFIDLSAPAQALPKADIVYSVAVFMHIPFWQAVRYFQWIYETLVPGGEAHLQFNQGHDFLETKFWCGTTEGRVDSVSTIRLDHELERAGLIIESKHLAEGEGVLPVWQMYRCIKGAT